MPFGVKLFFESPEASEAVKPPAIFKNHRANFGHERGELMRLQT